MSTHTLQTPAYENLTGATFRVGTPPFAACADLVLESVTQHPPSNPRTHSMSLIFQGPPQPFIDQGVYFLMHDELPPQALFIVPIGQNQQGFRYEIIFNSHTPDSTDTPTKGLSNE